jgi:hypothetical protein
MRRLTVGIALLFASIAGGIASAGVARADVPLTDDWPVSRTYVRTTMYVDALPDSGYAGCAVGVGYDSYADDYCAD